MSPATAEKSLMQKHGGKGETLGMAVLPKWDAENVGQGFIGVYLGSKEVTLPGKSFQTQVFKIIESDYVFADGEALKPGETVEVGGVRIGRAMREDLKGRSILIVYKGKDTEQESGTPANLFHIEVLPK